VIRDLNLKYLSKANSYTFYLKLSWNINLNIFSSGILAILLNANLLIRYTMV